MNTTAMTRRDLLRAAAAAGAAACIPLSAQARTKEPAKRPNIVLIMADDFGYECVAANGGTSYKTPVLDKLAAEGARFERCYAQPLCTPSRAQIMTGIYNVRNYVRFGVMEPKETTFAQLLRQAGYATCVAGKWQLLGDFEGPGHFGFDEYCLWQLNRRPSRYPNPGLETNGKQVDFNNGEYGPDVVSDYACGFMERNRDKPFLVYYPMILTHAPFEPTPDSANWDPKSRGVARGPGDVRRFADMVAYMDKMVGKLVSKLEELGLRENTLVLFTGDNGTDRPIVSMMGERRIQGGKGATTDAGTRVPLIANWPGVIPRGRTITDLVDFTDFLPTMCEAASAPPPKNLSIDGRSFLPQLKGKKGKPREWTYCWYSRNGDPALAREFARTHRYKLYSTGKFYDIENDVEEKKPIDEAALDRKAAKTKTMLQRALDKYKDARPEHLRRSVAAPAPAAAVARKEAGEE